MKRFAQDRYAPVKGLIDPVLVTRLRQEIDALVKATPEVPGCERPHNRLVPLRWDSPVVDCILEDAGRRRVVRELARPMTCGGSPATSVSRSHRRPRCGGIRTGGVGITP